MKKILNTFTLLLASFLFPQGTLYVHNYTNYDLEGRLAAQGFQNCLPSAITSFDIFPATTQFSITSFNSSLPYVDSWFVRISATAPGTIQYPPNSGLLSTISPLTRWSFCWFFPKDPITGVFAGDQFNMGDNTFSSQCNNFTNDLQNGVNTGTTAFWFYIPSTNETYLVYQ